jgi:hypothetical protein
VREECTGKIKHAFVDEGVGVDGLGGEGDVLDDLKCGDVQPLPTALSESQELVSYAHHLHHPETLGAVSREVEDSPHNIREGLLV